jgi:hypothetical protein
MRRRHVLAVLVGTIGTAGCTGDEGGEPSASTSRQTDRESPTQDQNLGTVEYTVTNGDDETHRLGVTMENAAGTVVQETNEPEFQPDTSVSSGDAGHDPDAGPFVLTFSTDSASETYEWDVRECGRVELSVTITSDGSITVERVLCQN